MSQFSSPCKDVSRQAVGGLWSETQLFSMLFYTGHPGARREPPGPKFVCLRDSTFSLIGLGPRPLTPRQMPQTNRIASHATPNKSNRGYRKAKTSIHKSFSKRPPHQPCPRPHTTTARWRCLERRASNAPESRAKRSRRRKKSNATLGKSPKVQKKRRIRNTNYPGHTPLAARAHHPQPEVVVIRI